MQRTAYFVLLFSIIFVVYSKAQESFTRADTLRGFLSPERTCFDVTYYHLDIQVDPSSKYIEGSNTIHFDVVEPTSKIQLDLFKELSIQAVLDENGRKLKLEREHNAFFVFFDQPLKKGTKKQLEVKYYGNPRVAPLPPWDGGVSWQKDEEGKPWVVVTCQGLGASVWWPNKDHQSDEPDSMLISITVPKGLKNISNGRLRKETQLNNNWTRFDWFVANPINNYCVTMNIGNYVHFQEQYIDGDTLDLDYYVLPYHLKEAKRQFKQVKPMMACFESHFGPYPFKEDGYKLVESPHPGMEHQSAVAYGNYFKNGYRLRSSSKIGLLFDFIIIHETAHEWFGNSITAKDVADMWIHESFGTYMEAVFAECELGYEAAMEYMRGKWYQVQLKGPVVGTYGVNHEGTTDMYPKGALLLNTLRHACGSDKKWFDMLLNMGNTFRHKVVDYDMITSFMSKELGRDYSKVFEQYLHKVEIPVLRANIIAKGKKQTLRYYWDADVKGFDLPVKVKVADNKWEIIYPTTERKEMTLKLSDPEEFTVSENFYVKFEKKVSYQIAD